MTRLKAGSRGALKDATMPKFGPYKTLINVLSGSPGSPGLPPGSSLRVVLARGDSPPKGLETNIFSEHARELRVWVLCQSAQVYEDVQVEVLPWVNAPVFFRGHEGSDLVQKGESGIGCCFCLVEIDSVMVGACGKTALMIIVPRRARAKTAQSVGAGLGKACPSITSGCEADANPEPAVVRVEVLSARAVI